ncbi:MAG: flippase-like domain-containing protein [Chloroflexi bacterium]|nr:flippase-like domain-containing protein [Chloroflexota bacterium]
MSSAKRALRLAIGFGISAVLIVLLVRGVDPHALQVALASADLRFLPLAIGLYFVAVYVRARRWKLLLPSGMVSTAILYKALLVGFMFNNLLPVRMGEVARIYLLGRWRRVPYGITTASLVVERILDGLALTALLLIGLLFVPAPAYLLGAGLLVGAIFATIAVVLALAAWSRGFLLRTAAILTRPLPAGVQQTVSRVLDSFVEGLRLVHGRARVAALMGLSLLGWLCELSVFYVVMLGFPMPHSWALALVSGATANFATLVPSSPGYVGTFDGALARVLQDTAGVPLAIALAYAVVVHATLFIPVVIAGAVVLWRSRVSLLDVQRVPRTAVLSADS